MVTENVPELKVSVQTENIWLASSQVSQKKQTDKYSWLFQNMKGRNK